MIRGIGTDICDIRRIEQLINSKGQRFLDKTFTSDEQAYCDAKARPGMCYAKRFAAKEAVAKALAGKETGALPWHSVEVVNDPSGRPRAKLTGPARERAAGAKIHLSLSDDYPYATAFAVAEADEDATDA
jgi:holo-[acyl-carrier protein] synthase